tara:strand:- start:117 stop:1367 length:1251 start_codon:yes stop_codon:yes gene_type:complete
MYAKLVFPGNTKTGEQVRDIVRLITSSTSSTASLSGLEFIDTTNSTVAGANSGWSLHSGSSLPSSGTAVSAADSNFTMQAVCATASKTKYCSIHVNGSWTHALATHTGDDFGFTMSSVLDPGASTEMWSNGYTGTTADIGDANSICGNIEHSDTGIHIFADARRIIIFGKDGNGYNILQMNGEFTETDTTTRYTLVPQAQIQLAGMYHGTVTNNVSYRGDTYAIWQQQTYSWSWISFCESMYSYQQGWTGKLRYTGWHHINDRATYDGKYRRRSTLDDSTQYGSSTNEVLAGYGASHASFEHVDNPARIMFGLESYNQSYNATTGYDAGYGRASSGAVDYDSSGNAGLALYKLWWSSPRCWNSDQQIFSDLCNIWRCAGGLGSDGDTVTIGSDVYVYLNENHTTPTSLGGYLIKRT